MVVKRTDVQCTDVQCKDNDARGEESMRGLLNEVRSVIRGLCLVIGCLIIGLSLVGLLMVPAVHAQELASGKPMFGKPLDLSDVKTKLAQADTSEEPQDSGGTGEEVLVKTPLKIKTKSGRTYDFTVELAMTRWARTRGLMYRKSIPSNGGLLMIFEPPQRAGVWMKNTFVSLDLMFIDSDGTIIRIVERTEPMSENINSARSPVKAVLEVLGGTAERLALSEGDSVIHEAFK